MHARQLAAALALSLLAPLAPARAQADVGAQAPAADARAKARKKRGTYSAKKKKKAHSAGAPSEAAKPTIDEETRRALEGATPLEAATPPKSATPPKGATPSPAAPAPAAPAPAAPVPAAEQAAAPAVTPAPEDNDPPSISHAPVIKALRGKPVMLTARITDPSGVFQPVVYLRKKGMGSGEYIPIKLIASRTTQGEYAVEIPAALVTADLEYYVEAFDNVGNGPARAGSPEKPIGLKVEDEPKKIIVAPKAVEPPAVTVRQRKGAPPAISHTAVTTATKGQPVEINARLIGETGVQGATVLFRHVGEKEFRALPMGDIGNESYTATIPAQMVTGDLEYYLEAFDKFGNGPGRSGAPNAAYRIQILEAVKDAPFVVRSGSTTSGAGSQPRLVKAPFRPNPGRAVGWLMMAGFVGSGIFAGGETLGGYKANDQYTHSFDYEGRLRPELLAEANAYGHRAKIFAIAAGASLVTSIVLLILFPEHPDTMLVGGSGGDVPALVRF